MPTNQTREIVNPAICHGWHKVAGSTNNFQKGFIGHKRTSRLLLVLENDAVHDGFAGALDGGAWLTLIVS